MPYTSGGFIKRWNRAIQSGKSNRIDSATDRLFWQHFAQYYDQRTGGLSGEQVTISYLSKLLKPTDSLLDVGAGTGRFAIPLAHSITSVTAIDHSPEMLAILEQKANIENLQKIKIIEAEWPYLDVQPHDLVLAAWSLYRSSDLKSVLESLIKVTKRTLVIVLGVGDSPPHRSFLEHLSLSWNEATFPGHLYISGALWEMGYFAETQILKAQRSIKGKSAIEIAKQIAPISVTDTIVEQLATALKPHLKLSNSEFEYSYNYYVGIVTLDM